MYLCTRKYLGIGEYCSIVALLCYATNVLRLSYYYNMKVIIHAQCKKVWYLTSKGSDESICLTVLIIIVVLNHSALYPRLSERSDLSLKRKVKRLKGTGADNNLLNCWFNAYYAGICYYAQKLLLYS